MQRIPRHHPWVTLQAVKQLLQGRNAGTLKYIGPNRGRPSVRVLILQKACVLLRCIKVEPPGLFFDAESWANSTLEPRVMKNEKE